MPYINPERRSWLDSNIDRLSADIETVGELNYTITRLAMRLIKRLGKNYTNISTVIGTLTLVPLEMQRRFIGRYEDEKIVENGDVPEYR